MNERERRYHAQHRRRCCHQMQRHSYGTQQKQVRVSPTNTCQATKRPTFKEKIQYLFNAQQKDKHNLHMTRAIMQEWLCLCLLAVQLFIAFIAGKDIGSVYHFFTDATPTWWSELFPTCFGVAVTLFFDILMVFIVRVLQIIKYEIRNNENDDQLLALAGIAVAVWTIVLT